MNSMTNNATMPMRIDHVTSERVNQRKYRDRPGRYGLELTLTLMLGSEEFCGRCRDNKYGEVNASLLDIAKDLPFTRAFNPASYWHHYDVECPECGWSRSIIRGITLTFWLGADRPKDILSESQAQKAIAQNAPENAERGYGRNQERPLTLEQILVQRVNKQFALFQREVKRKQIASQASRIAEWAAGNADKQARAGIKFDERLEALKAELKAEQERALARFLADEMAQGLEETEGEWHPMAVKLGADAASKLLPSAIPTILGRSAEPAVKLADVPEDIEGSQDEDVKADVTEDAA